MTAEVAMSTEICVPPFILYNCYWEVVAPPGNIFPGML